MLYAANPLTQSLFVAVQISNPTAAPSYAVDVYAHETVNVESMDVEPIAANAITSLWSTVTKYREMLELSSTRYALTEKHNEVLFNTLIASMEKIEEPIYLP